MDFGKDELMQLKLFGALCIVIGGGGYGFIMASQHRKTIRLLKELAAILEDMECELRYRCLPLPQLCRTSVRNHRDPIANVFSALADELDSQISPDVERCMSVVLQDRVQVMDPIRRILADLGKNLGRFDLEGQLRGLEHTKTECCNLLNIFEYNQENRMRSYQTLGLCAGAALAILFV